MTAAVSDLLTKLGISFANPELARQALTHRSRSAPHNERLEFLGDAVLECAISALLYTRHAEIDEGALSIRRAALVREATLAQIARDLELGEYLLLGAGERQNNSRQRASILANALEALIGAAYVDGGYATALALVTKLFQPLLDSANTHSDKDAKSVLQERLQARRLGLPAYRLVSALGQAHAQIFLVECQIDKLGITTQGEGNSRRAAEQVAARCALDLLAKTSQ